MRLKGYEIDIDIQSELHRYDFERVRIEGAKFIACSPFRRERHPSFAVNLENGTWIDSGTDDEDWKKGNFPKLLAYLRNETYDEAVEYLLLEYTKFLVDVDKRPLNLKLPGEKEIRKPYSRDILKPYAHTNPYLFEKRRIKLEYQRAFFIGFDKKSKAVAFPWFDKDAQIVNIKFRSVKDKKFWYLPGGLPIKENIYGIHYIFKYNINTAHIVESEIDAVYLWQNGFPSIALGGSNLTEIQKDLINESPIRELVICTDNDKAGNRIKKSIINEFAGYKDLKEIFLPDGIKDVNELPPEKLQSILKNPAKINFKFVA